MLLHNQVATKRDGKLLFAGQFKTLCCFTVNKLQWEYADANQCLSVPFIKAFRNNSLHSLTDNNGQTGYNEQFSDMKYNKYQWTIDQELAYAAYACGRSFVFIPQVAAICCVKWRHGHLESNAKLKIGQLLCQISSESDLKWQSLRLFHEMTSWPPLWKVWHHIGNQTASINAPLLDESSFQFIPIRF